VTTRIGLTKEAQPAAAVLLARKRRPALRERATRARCGRHERGAL
jgi:hypothetical protein